MARVLQRQLEDILPQLPTLEGLDPSAPGYGGGDIYLCALGFEERCLALPTLMARHQHHHEEAIYVTVGTNVEDNLRNQDALLALIGAFCSHHQELNADNPNYERILRLRLSRLAGQLGREPRVTFDISVAANRLLLKTLKVLLESDIELHIVYAEATVYHPTRIEFETDPEKWIADDSLGTEQGVSLVIPSPSYAGQQLDPLPNFVILFPSFRKDRSLAVLSAVDETLVTGRHQDVTWIIGKPHLDDDAWRMDAMRRINQPPADSPQYEVSTFDYCETLMTLERIYRERWDRNNITISPLGSKLQALGTGLFCYLHPEVRVMFSAPRRYNANVWSEGYRSLWTIEYGRTKELRDKLGGVGLIMVDN